MRRQIYSLRDNRSLTVIWFDSQEEESYIALLCDNNFENDLDAVIANIKIETDQLHSGYVYRDINNKR